LEKRRPKIKQFSRKRVIPQRKMAGYAYNRAIVQILLFHEADAEFVQQRLYDKETQAKEQYGAAEFIYYVNNIFFQKV
jgi:hypothetical protein